MRREIIVNGGDAVISKAEGHERSSDTLLTIRQGSIPGRHKFTSVVMDLGSLRQLILYLKEREAEASACVRQGVG